MRSVIRGTTPTLSFKIPFGTELLAEGYITLAQNNEEVLSKQLCDCNLKDDIISVRLTQTETLELNSDCTTQIQLRVRTVEGEALASQIITVSTHRILRDGVI